jgi:energy-coupling factor transporter ATP-binding protein EcfA2
LTGGATVEVEGLGWRPLRRRRPVFSGLDLVIPAGQRVLLAGPSGAGKSSLLRAMAGLLLTAGSGELSGTVRIGKGEIGGERAGRVGLLLQDPLAGLVADTVGRDVAFGLENSSVPRHAIWPRVHAALRDTAFPYPVDHPTAALSGGEAQRLALAGSLAFGGEVMLLDEPTSMLDPAAAASVREAVRRAAADRSRTTVIVEHRLEPWLDFADRLLVLGADGSLVADGDPRHVLDLHGPWLASRGVWVPGQGPPRPLDVDSNLVEPYAAADGELVCADGLRKELPAAAPARRSREGTARTVAVDGVSISVHGGRALGVTGDNGAGKSTLVSLLAGLARPTAGHVTAPALGGRQGDLFRWPSRALSSRVSWVPQLPEHGVVATTVLDEVTASGRACGRPSTWLARRADDLLEQLGLSHLRESSPYHLSGGEQRRLMLAASLAHGPNVVVLDEPTVGQDSLTWAAVVGVVGAARDAGCGVALASHDADAVGAVADDRLRLERGRATR